MKLRYIAASLLICSLNANADMYQCLDDTGKIVFTDRSCPEGGRGDRIKAPSAYATEEEVMIDQLEDTMKQYKFENSRKKITKTVVTPQRCWDIEAKYRSMLAEADRLDKQRRKKETGIYDKLKLDKRIETLRTNANTLSKECY